MAEPSEWQRKIIRRTLRELADILLDMPRIPIEAVILRAIQEQQEADAIKCLVEKVLGNDGDAYNSACEDCAAAIRGDGK